MWVSKGIPSPERNRALGIWGGAGAAGLVVGVLLGGVLTRAFGWEAVLPRWKASDSSTWSEVRSKTATD